MLDKIKFFLLQERITKICSIGREFLNVSSITLESDLTAKYDLVILSSNLDQLNNKLRHFVLNNVKWILASANDFKFDTSPIITFKDDSFNLFSIWKNKNYIEPIMKPLLCCVVMIPYSVKTLKSIIDQDYPNEKIQIEYIRNDFDVKESLQRIIIKTNAKYLLMFQNNAVLHSKCFKKLVKVMENTDYDLLSPRISDEFIPLDNLKITELKEPSLNFILRLENEKYCFYGPDDYSLNLYNSVLRKAYSNIFNYGTFEVSDLIHNPKAAEVPKVAEVPFDIGPFDTIKYFRTNQPRAPPLDKYFTIKLFSDAEIKEIMNYALSLPCETGTVGSRDIQTAIRNSHVRWIPNNGLTHWLYRKVSEVFVNINKSYYGFNLIGLTENIQFTEYNEGEGYYHYHMDSGSNSPYRRLSLTVQLSDPSEYEGGTLQILTVKEPIDIIKEKGSAIIFPSYMMHKVTEITKGTRYSLVCWCTGIPMI